MSRLGGRFVLEKEIGSGGMASVYLGTDEVLERRVAVKVLNPEFQESDVGARFRREGRTSAGLSHPNVVRVFDAGEDDLDGRRVSYIVMEHVSGGDLRQKIVERGTLPAEEVSNLSGVAGGLAHAHEKGIVHRDVKPHNILMDENGQPKLTDFGIARALDATQFTQTGMYLGTARYSSPEQLQGEITTAKSDVYSLGITLYEAVTGETPFSGTAIEIATQHVSKPPLAPGELVTMDEELETLILDCLAKAPVDRPSASAVESRLKNLTKSTGPAHRYAAAGAAAPAESRGAAAPTRAATAISEDAPRRSPKWVPAAVGIFAILALLGALGAYAMLGGEDRAAQTPAVTSAETVPRTTTPSAAQRTEASPAPNTSQGETAQGSSTDSESSGRSEAEQAARATRDVYRLAASGDYGQSYALLSEDFKQSQVQTQAKWANTFGTLQKISFQEGPDVQISNGTAEAEGVTRAVHSDRTERNTVTWSLVKEDGGWKLDGVNISNQEIVG